MVWAYSQPEAGSLEFLGGKRSWDTRIEAFLRIRITPKPGGCQEEPQREALRHGLTQSSKAEPEPGEEAAGQERGLGWAQGAEGLGLGG